MQNFPPQSNAPDQEPPQPKEPVLASGHSAAASWIFGAVLLIFLIVIVFLIPNASDTQKGIIRFLMALAAALFAFFFVGGVLLRGTVKGLFISATGGFVLFVLIQFVFDPFKLSSASKDGTNPQPSPSPTLESSKTNESERPPNSISTNLPEGMKLRTAIKFLAEIDGYNVDISKDCDNSLMNSAVVSGPLMGKSTIELIELLPLRLEDPKPRSVYRVIRTQEKGIYEITCK
jgi:hypothetical protein